MLTGNSLLDTLVDELNELGLPNMAVELDRLYASHGFLEMDRLELISELIFSEYRDEIIKRINNRLSSAKLIGCPAETGTVRIPKKGNIYLPTFYRCFLRWILLQRDLTSAFPAHPILARPVLQRRSV